MSEEKKMIVPTAKAWDDATMGKYIKLPNDGTKLTLGITNWSFSEKVFDESQGPVIMIDMDVFEYQGNPVTDKVFSKSGANFLSKLRPHLESLENTSRVKLSFSQHGTGNSTVYVVEKVE